MMQKIIYKEQIMRELLMFMIIFCTACLTMLVLPTILCTLICANVSIWRWLLTVFICLAILFTTSAISKMLMPLMRITPASDQHMLINLFVFMPLYILISSRIIKKFITVGIGKAIVLSVIVMICALSGSVITALMMMRMLIPK